MRRTLEQRVVMEAVLQDIREERARQEERYGDVNPLLQKGTGPETRWLLPYTSRSATEIEADLRNDYKDFEEEVGQVTWLHLLREELAEVAMEDDLEKLYEEVIQLAALCVSLNERIIDNYAAGKEF